MCACGFVCAVCLCVDISSSAIKLDVGHRNYDCSQAWEADMRGLMFSKAFIAKGQ